MKRHHPKHGKYNKNRPSWKKKRLTSAKELGEIGRTMDWTETKESRYTVTKLIFYIRHCSGCLCGARRPIGLIGDRLCSLVNRSPRQRAPLTAFCPHYSWIKEKPVTTGLELRPSRKSFCASLPLKESTAAARQTLPARGYGIEGRRGARRQACGYLPLAGGAS
ncbi:unnamed protein product [Pleuronectes platessa]|uniref:Uncharacterized protein n=1 Tax=Pleuronectes platessa TaxID=8262 RepID=A0A9N7VTQ4_PLEPL|nr:unnamed protein product [Pleuronectes platessa]